MSALGQEGSVPPHQCFSEPKLLLITKNFRPFPAPPLLNLIMLLVVRTISLDEPHFRPPPRCQEQQKLRVGALPRLQGRPAVASAPGPKCVTGVMRGAANGKPGLSESAPQGRGARLMGPHRPHAPQRPERALPAALPLTGLLMWGHQGELRKRLSGLLISFLNSQDDRPLPSRAHCVPDTEFSPARSAVLNSVSVMRKLRQRGDARLAPNASLTVCLHYGVNPSCRPCPGAQGRDPPARRSPAVSIAGAGGGRASCELPGPCPRLRDAPSRCP